MFACIASGYPREPLAGQPDRLGDADRRLAAGEIDEASHAAVMSEVVTEVLREQEGAGLAVLADGGVTRTDRLRPIVEGLGGSSSGRFADLPEGQRVTVPRFDRGVSWRSPILLDEWRSADAATDLFVKQGVIGPYTIARLAVRGDAKRRSLALGLAEALNTELRALAEAGCPIIQVDEGGITQIGDDPAEWRLYADTQRRLTAGLEDHHLSLGLFSGAAHPSGHAAILDGPYRSYVVDVLAGPDAWRFVFATPPERGLIAGALDARLEARDETEVLVWALAWAAEGGRGNDRVGVASNGSLGQVSRHMARRKIERLGEAIRVANMGPLAEVALALDPDPVNSTMPELRVLGEAVAAARGPA